MEFSDENTQFYKLLYNHRKIYTHSHSVCLGCCGDSFEVGYLFYCPRVVELKTFFVLKQVWLRFLCALRYFLPVAPPRHKLTKATLKCL